MTSVGVVGNGFWGSAICEELEQAGHDVTLIDEGATGSGSAAAQGLARLDWLQSPVLARVLPEWWRTGHSEASEAALVRLRAESVVEAVTTWAVPIERIRTGLLLVNPAEARRTPDVRGKVVRVLEGDGHIGAVLEGGDSLFFRHLVLATGVWTDAILERSDLPKLGIESLIGSTALASPQGSWTRKAVRTYVWAPYRHISVRRYTGGMVQIGATTAKDGEAEDRAYAGMLAKAKEKWPELEPEFRLTGHRPVGPGGKAVVDKLTERLIVATGGSRIGLVMAGGVGRRVRELVG